MADNEDLWLAVKTSFPQEDLISLTAPNDPSADTPDDDQGEDAAQEVIDRWPLWTQVAYDGSNSQHVTVAKDGVIAVLWRRGGTSSELAQVKWESVFGPEGMISKVRQVLGRGRPTARSSSDSRNPSETRLGRPVIDWANRRNAEPNLPRSLPADP